MNFNLKAKDWWTERGWTAATDGAQCEVCGSGYGIAFDPDDETPMPLCRFHGQMSDTGMAEFFFHKTAGRKISRERCAELLLNSYDRDTLLPYMSDEVLCDAVEYALGNCLPYVRPASTYPEAVQMYAAEMAKRMTVNFSDKIGTINRLIEEVRVYKADHPEAVVPANVGNPGSILNAYREGDLTFEDTIVSMRICFLSEISREIQKLLASRG